MNIRGMRIAIFSGAYNHIADGVSLTLNRLVAYLGDQGAQVQVYAPTTETPSIAHAGKLVPVPSISAPGRPEYRVSLGLGKSAQESLTEFKPHLFHIATPDFLGLAALRAARRTQTPIVASYHTHFASYPRYYGLGFLEGSVWRYLRWFYRHCRQIYVPTSSMIEVLKANGIDQNLKLWPRGVESDLFNPDKRSMEWRRTRGFDIETPVIAFVSRLVTEKGLDVVVDVLRELEKNGIAHHALFAGDGPERSRLEKSLPHARFEGHLKGPDLATAYASSDIFLFPSETETFGNVTLEALSSGLPAVVANATGSNALVEDGVNGFLATPRDSKSFIDKVTGLATDPQLRKTMGATARERAEGYDWSRILALIPRYYEEI